MNDKKNNDHLKDATEHHELPKPLFDTSEQEVVSNEEHYEIPNVPEDISDIGQTSRSNASIGNFVAGRTGVSFSVYFTHNPGSALNPQQDIVLQRLTGSPGSYAYVNTSGWTIRQTSTQLEGRYRFFRATADNTVLAGTYRVFIAQNAFGSNRPSQNEYSHTLYFAGRVFSANWTSVTYTPATRAITSTINLSEEVTTAFSISDDFKVEKRSGTAGSYTWTEDTNWSFTEPIPASAPVFAASPSGSLTEDIAYDQTITATGYPTPVITSSVSSGTLPEGLTLNGPRLYGTPIEIPISGSTFSVTYTARNTEATVTRVVSYAVGTIPVFASFTATNLTENSAYDQTITASGSPAPTITSSVTSGTLPTGLTLNGARLHGTPAVGSGGTSFTITYTARNNRRSVTTAIVFNVGAQVNPNRAPVFQTFTATSLTENVAYDQTITATGFPAPTITSSITRPRIVRAYYARPSSAAAVTSAQKTHINTVLVACQTFFSNEMNRLGHGIQTFDLVVDSSNNVEVNEIILTSSEATYHASYTDNLSLRARVYREANVNAHDISLFFMYRQLMGNARGLASINGPWGIQDGPPLGSGWRADTVAHEIGHTLGLLHSHAGTNRCNVMYPGSNVTLSQSTLSAASAQHIADHDTLQVTGGNPHQGLTLNGARLHGTPTNVPSGGLTFSVNYTAKNIVATVQRIVNFTIANA